MSEFITIQVGQCGNQIGSAFWPLILQEYGILNVPGGIQRRSSSTTLKPQLNESFNSFFSVEQNFESSSNSYKYSELNKYNVKARAILIDMEDSVVDRYHSGPLRNLFDKCCTVKNYPGSGNNWAEGYLTHGTEYRTKIESILSEAVEKCNNLIGFLLMYSVGGGTGSGLGSFVLELLEELFPNIDRFVTCVYPNGSEDVITSPYNMILATKYLTDYATCVFPVENRALLDIVRKQIIQTNCPDTTSYIIKCKPFQDMNTLIVNMLLNLTSGSRFTGGLNVDMNDISTNLIPFPKMHFICSSVSPVTVSVDQLKRHLHNRKIHNDIFLDCCHKKNQLVKIDPLGLNSLLMGVSIISRGDFTMSDIRSYVEQLQKRGHYTQWSRQSIKVGLCSMPPAGHDASMLGLFNTSSMVNLFDEVLQQFNKLYIKKAHTHHYAKVDGFEIDYFNTCRDSLLTNIENYRSLSYINDIDSPRFKIL